MEQWKKPEIVELHSQSTESSRFKFGFKNRFKRKFKKLPIIGCSGIMPR